MPLSHSLVVETLPASRQERTRAYREAVASFADGGWPCARVRLAKKQEAAYKGLRLAVSDLGLADTVRVARRKDSLYLVRK